ncbi:hypothetical protein [Erythrobacter donghaensis]|uniref:hypothetical protein n=1 Tax=Erythrobacter donghaensis TaxID=267135 RepID=UPI00117F7F54|nr:hypothetical protein [Erythrobacter donghaensis]
MFHAIKQWFVSADNARRLLGLFAFEFVVVLLGVLAAQSLQTVYASRQLKQLADDAVAEHRDDLQDFVDFMEYQRRANDCQRDYLRRLRNAAASGTKPDDLPFRPPAYPQVWVAQWDSETRRAVRRFYGRELLLEHTRLERGSELLKLRRDQAIIEWGTTSLVATPDFGKDAGVRSAIIISTGKLYAITVDMRNLAINAGTTFDRSPYTPDETKIGQALSSLVGCELTEKKAVAGSGQ